MYCPNCGQKVEKYAKFCSQCGSEIKTGQEKTLDGVSDKARKENSENKESKKGEPTKEGSTKKEGGNWGAIKKFIFSPKIPKEAKLSSPEPLDDGLIKYNYWYIIFCVLCLMGGQLSGIVVGLVLGWIAKVIITGFRSEHLKMVNYRIEEQIPLNVLQRQLVMALEKYGMIVELKKEYLTVSCSTGTYEIYYEKPFSFKMIPGVSVAKRLFKVGFVSDYRKNVINLGVIGAAVTGICSGKQEMLRQLDDQVTLNNYRVAHNKNRIMTVRGYVVGTIVTVIAVFALYYQIFEGQMDYSGPIKNGVLEGTTFTVGEAFDDFFGNLSWQTSPSTEKDIYLVEAIGDCFYQQGDECYPVACSVEFVFNKDTDYFYIQKITAQDQIYEGTNIASFIDDIYGVRKKQVNSVGDAANLFGEILGQALDDTLFGSYISYEEGKKVYEEENL